MVLENDTRGWVLAVTSGIACVFGASIICVDVFIRQLPGKKNFKIQDSNPFLSAGLSLSFGVMISSSLYSMLPSARRYLEKGGLESRPAGFVLIVCFLLGALGIGVLSRIIHRFIPHSIVGCNHDHGDEEESLKQPNAQDDIEATPLHPTEDHGRNFAAEHAPVQTYGTMPEANGKPGLLRRPSLNQISSRVSQLVSGHKMFCDEDGQCHGFSDPCGKECFRIVQQSRTGVRLLGGFGKGTARPSGTRAKTSPQERQQQLPEVDELEPLMSTQSNPVGLEYSSDSSDGLNGSTEPADPKHSDSTMAHRTSDSHTHHGDHDHHDHHHAHHHHVPTNVFLSIGLQTSIAIALHKLPEGFITYATNHANPRLGFSVFLALFIHNITEGFAMALPLYLAINSRWKAMFWSTILGGFTQPLGAGVAALWFRAAGREEDGGGPGERVYGVMFSLTAGVMAMVALQLFGESLDLTHSRQLCFGFAFVGMGVLGVSSALTA